MKRTEKLQTVNIKGKQYTEVNQRILFLANHFDYEILTDFKFYENQNMWVVKAILKIHDKQGVQRTYQGTAQEIIGDGYINKTSALENCETSAIGRACAMAGIGVIESVCSVDEINKAKAREKYNKDNQSNGVSKELKWLNKYDGQNNLTVQWQNIAEAVNNGRITTVEDVRKYYKVSREIAYELEQLLNFQPKKTA